MSLFTITDIDYYLVDFLSINDLISLLAVNSYYYHVINSYKRYNIARRFHEHKDEIDKCMKCEFTCNINNELFIKACHYGDLEIVQYLLSKYIIDIHAADDFAFVTACECGNLDICQFLCAQGNVNVSTITPGFKEAPFTLACIHGHLDVAQWLYRNFPIDINNY